MKLLFIHGFNSAGYGEKVNHLREAFGDENIINPTLPPNPKKAIQLLDYLVYHLNDKNFCVVGSSLGAYYGLYLAKKFKIITVLINPALKASELLKDYVGRQLNFKTNEEYTFKKSYLNELKKIEVSIEILKEIKEKLFIYMDEDDEVLDSKKTAEVFKDFYVKLFKGGNHSFAHMPELIADFKNSPGNNF